MEHFIKRFICSSSLLFVSIAIFSLYAKNRSSIDYETTVPELYSLKNTLAQFYDNSRQKLAELYAKASRTRTTICLETHYEKKHFDWGVYRELEAISSTLEDIQKRFEEIQHEVRQAMQTQYHNEPAAELKKEDQSFKPNG